MVKIFKNLWVEKKTVLAIILLLIVQAYCDLMLPNYTSDIVDVGIMQKGIESVSPDVMSEENYKRFFEVLREADYEEQNVSIEAGLVDNGIVCFKNTAMSAYSLLKKL